ncbi:patatin-like phospholipase family protein [Mesorhizobium loti]|uniref:patatin-like phospholipase family protein n=1 Tax=Rhizobium loti TaxID=381 RepID=UPI00047AB81A|nr:patatin-like phospholipase family protein [Mesorhizobium loti]
MPLTFDEIFREELDVVNFRRKAIRSGKVAQRRSQAAGAPARHFLVERADAAIDNIRSDLSRGTVRTRKNSNLTGIALSGGGERSACYCLGVLQALESLSPPGHPRPLDAVDYLSTVSGGGYIGTSVVVGMMQEDHSFPFESRLDEEETPETQHLRDFSNFLVPAGARDYLVSISLVMRGLLVNALIVLPALLLLAAITVAVNPTVTELETPDLLGYAVDKMHMLNDSLKYFTLTVVLGALAALLMFGSAIYTSLTYHTGTLRSREILGRALGVLIALVFASAVIDLQPLVLSGMISSAGKAANQQLIDPKGPFHDYFEAFANILPALATALIPTIAVLVSVAQKLAKIAEASLGSTWGAVLKKNTSRIFLYLAAVIVPFMLWVAYIYLSYWATRGETGWCGVKTPNWLMTVTFCGSGWQPEALQRFGPIGTTYLGVALLLGLICLLIGPNSNSLHRLYRDRLSRAFLMQRKTINQQPSEDVDTWKFSSLKQFDEKTDETTRETTKVWKEGAAFSPYLLSNAAINLEGSKELNKRGRNADNFIFSPLHVGSQSTGYVKSTEIEDAVKDLTWPPQWRRRAPQRRRIWAETPSGF